MSELVKDVVPGQAVTCEIVGQVAADRGYRSEVDGGNAVVQTPSKGPELRLRQENAFAILASQRIAQSRGSGSSETSTS